MTLEVSLVGRFAAAVAAVALFSASLGGPASAQQWQNNHPHPGPGHGGPGGPVHGGAPGHGGNWAHGGGGGGGHWHNGVWVPLAVGFGLLGAAAAASAYGAPPEPGMCWYYDDPFHTTGHWDYC